MQKPLQIPINKGGYAMEIVFMPEPVKLITRPWLAKFCLRSGGIGKELLLQKIKLKGKG